MLARIDLIEPKRPPPVDTSIHAKLGCWRYPLIVLLGLMGLALGEIGSFAWSMRRCNFPINRSDMQLFAAVSDVHLLGASRSSLDVAWTTWQIQKAFYFIMDWINPDAMFILGDHLDQGGYASQNEWNEYVERYRGATRAIKQRMIVVDSVMGNHDAQFAHMGLTPNMIERFTRAFGEVNGVLKLGEVEIVWINSLALFDETKSKPHLDAMSLLTNLEAEDQDSFRILLSHVPPFRQNDLDCGKSRLRETGHVTYVAPSKTLNAGSDVLHADISKYLLDAVRPDVMLSGHLHSHCYRHNYYEVTSDGKRVNVSFLDISVPAFSYRMRPDPGFTIVAVSQGHAHGKTCRLPNERVVIAMDVVALLIILYGLLGWIFACHRMSAASAFKKLE